MSKRIACGILGFLLLATTLESRPSDTHYIDPQKLISHPDYPMISPTAYVLIEIWGAVKDITLTAYFLEESPERNENVCYAVRKSLTEALAQKTMNTEAGVTTYHLCMPLADAVRKGYIKPEVGVNQKARHLAAPGLG